VVLWSWECNYNTKVIVLEITGLKILPRRFKDLAFFSYGNIVVGNVIRVIFILDRC
jgi:hypothetical protein